MKAVVALIIVLDLAVCCTAKLAWCPADLGEEVENERQDFEEVTKDLERSKFNSETEPEVVRCCEKAGFKGVLDAMSAQKAVLPEIKPNFEIYLKPKCPVTGYFLTKFWHEGEMCYVIKPQWQRIYAVKCDYRLCCDNDFMKRCRPTAYVTYTIFVFCPKTMKCKIIRRRYATDCRCKGWSCYCPWPWCKTLAASQAISQADS